MLWNTRFEVTGFAEIHPNIMHKFSFLRSVYNAGRVIQKSAVPPKIRVALFHASPLRRDVENAPTNTTIIPNEIREGLDGSSESLCIIKVCGEP